jgi:two-component system LytT family response regulator
VLRPGGARAESRQEREGEESPARRECSGTPASWLHERGYAAIERPIERLSHADRVSSHSSRGAILLAESQRHAVSDDENANADDEEAGAAEQSHLCHPGERSVTLSKGFRREDEEDGTVSEATSNDRIRVLIVDDELLARDRTRQLLEEEPDVEIVGECASGPEAVAAIESAGPDLVLLDVQMPGMDGFAVLAKVSPGRLPAVVFVTAHDEHALEAFQVHALDYLLKPFDGERLREALERARERIRSTPPHAFQRRILAMLADFKPRARRLDRIVLRSGGRLSFLKTDEVDWIEGEGNYLRVHAGKQSYLLRETLSDIEARLDPARFVRIHKSTIVNTDRIREIQPLFNGAHSVLLHDGTRLTWSRGYRAGLRALTGEEA